MEPGTGCDNKKNRDSTAVFSYLKLNPNIILFVRFKVRCEDIDKKEAKMKEINKLGHEITSESLSTTTTETVEEKLEALNIRWRDIKEMLKDYRDKDDDEAAGYQSCCCFQMMTKAFHACFYS